MADAKGKQADAAVEAEQPFLTHLLELRDRLLRIVLGVLVVFIVLFPFANDLYTTLAGPLMKVLPTGSSMIAIEVASPFLTPFKLTLVLSFYLAMPVVLHQMWGFIAPGLYSHEKKLLLPLLVSSSLLFYLGMAFAYFVVFPLVFGFLTGTTPDGVQVMTDINKYLDFVLTLFFAFGLAFEVPIATILLVASGAVTRESLKDKRPYIIVGAFVIGMFLTPPDVISQTLLALPMWLLFEVGLIASVWFEKQGRAAAAARDARHNPDEHSILPAAGAAGGAAAAAANGDDDPSPPEDGPGGGTNNSDARDGGAAALNNPTDESSWTADGDDNYLPMTDAEMEAELDRMEEDDEDDEYFLDEEEDDADQDNAEQADTEPKEFDFDEMSRKALAGELTEADWNARGFTTDGLEEELDIMGATDDEEDSGEWIDPEAEKTEGEDAAEEPGDSDSSDAASQDKPTDESEDQDKPRQP